MNETINLLWDYYKKAAEVFGRITIEDKETGEPVEAQARYSLLWYYMDEEEKRGLNDLTRAFLGDADAKARLCWNESLPGGLEHYFLEGEKNYPNESQIRAIRTALSNPISFIQGPPGTGKTTAILNLASCITAMGKNVAIVSGNVNALKTIWKKIDEFSEDADKPNQSRVKRSLAKLGNKERRNQFNKDHGLTGEEAFESEAKQYLPNAAVSRETHVEFVPFLRQYPVITSTIHSLKCCFKNEERLCYDYVIIDESSQVDTVKGILAMSCAKHLILVGDEQQLPPVLNQEQIERMEQEWEAGGAGRVLSRELHTLYGMKAEKSFLEVCLDVFRAKRPQVKVFLEEHYRCHPGIIQFCNREEIYNGALKIRTMEYDKKVKIPIKVLWFEGDYCESCHEKKKRKNNKGEEILRSTKRNRKQADIFVTEELPELIRRMANKEISDVCILSPFRGQLQELKERIEQYNKEHNTEMQVLMPGDKSADKGAQRRNGAEDRGPEAEEEQEDRIPRLIIPSSTIHSSQGDEYDMVYLLPVEDGEWEWPWSQQKRLVNVAVSRAVKELRLIVSSVMMSPQLQQELTDHEFAEDAQEEGHADDAAAGAEEGAGEQARAKENQMFIRKLADYVWENGTYADYRKGFGFHRAGQTSVFDLGYWKRQESGETKNQEWPTELCVEDAIRKMPFFVENRLEFYHNVRIEDIQDEEGRPLDFSGLDEELLEFIHNDAEFDYILCSRGRILLVIEVDGLYHRFNYNLDTLEQQKEADRRKNKLVEEFFGGVYYQGNSSRQEIKDGSFAFIRLPSDGSSFLETLKLWEKAEEQEQRRVFPLEQLLERQLAASDEGSYRFVPMTFWEVISEYQADEEEWVERCLGEKNQRKALRDLLLDGGYLKLKGNRAIPTKRGRNKGMVRGCRVDDRGKKCETYITPFILKRMSDFIRERLREGREL